MICSKGLNCWKFDFKVVPKNVIQCVSKIANFVFGAVFGAHVWLQNDEECIFHKHKPFKNPL